MARRPERDSALPKYASERQDLILQRARRNGRVEVAALAEEFKVTTETIRRDLVALESQGAVSRVHGGALLADRRHEAPDLSVRMATMAKEKEAIARAALREVPAEGSVLIDAGSTNQRLAELFPDRSLTVITNSIQIASTLLTKPRLIVYTTGGQINRSTLSEVGLWAGNSLGSVFADVAFLGSYGFTPERGASATNEPEANVKRAMVASSERVVLLMDHTKLGVNHFAQFAAPNQVDLLITDGRADPEYVEHIRASGSAVVAADA